MAFAIALFLRDTALRNRQQGIELTRAALGNFGVSNHTTPGVFSGNSFTQNPYQMDNGRGEMEDISWLLR
jgi:hypothetical protein